MPRTITAIFDGETLRPTEPLDLKRNAEYRVTIEDAEPPIDEETYPLAKFARYAMDLGITDLPEQHDHYLYGTPKR